MILRRTLACALLAALPAVAAPPAVASDAAQDAFLRLALEVCPKVVSEGPEKLAAYVTGFPELAVEPLTWAGPENETRRSFATMLDVTPETPIVQVVSRDPAKQRANPLLSVATGSRRCVVMRAEGDATFAELQRRFAKEPGWSKVVTGKNGSGVWVRYDANERPLFTLNTWFVDRDPGRTLYVQTLPLRPQQVRQ